MKQANFRLPLEYMSMIDEFAHRENITKAAVITRALDCMKASYDAGNGGLPVTASEASAAEQEVKELREKLAAAEARAAEISSQLTAANERAAAAEARANEAGIARDAAEIKAAAAASSIPQPASYSAVSDDEVIRLRTLVATQEASLEEKVKTLGAKEAELASKNTIIAERDARIATLNMQLNEANARAQFAPQQGAATQAETIDPAAAASEESLRALSLLNTLGGVMDAFKQQVVDARQLGEQEGRKAAREEFKDVVSRARNDGYRDAMTYLDDRVSTAREAGAKEERARIANMGFFERRRYLKVHLT